MSPASTKMVIYVEGAKSRPVEEALRKYGYLNLLRFEKELKKRGQTFSGYVAADGLNPVELIENAQDEGDSSGRGGRAKGRRVLGGAGQGGG